MSRSIDRIKETIAANVQRRFSARVLSVSIDRKNILVWRQELDRFLQIFNVGVFPNGVTAHFT
jgi:hypothetical protein